MSAKHFLCFFVGPDSGRGFIPLTLALSPRGEGEETGWREKEPNHFPNHGRGGAVAGLHHRGAGACGGVFAIHTRVTGKTLGVILL